MDFDNYSFQTPILTPLPFFYIFHNGHLNYHQRQLFIQHSPRQQRTITLPFFYLFQSTHLTHHIPKWTATTHPIFTSPVIYAITTVCVVITLYVTAVLYNIHGGRLSFFVTLSLFSFANFRNKVVWLL